MSRSASVEPILTARLVLRTARAGDLDAFAAILSDPVAMRHWSTAPHDSREDSAAWLDRMIERAGLGLERVIEMEGRVIGKAGAHRLPEVGFLLHRDFWGKGIMTEAMAALVAHVWATTATDHLFADVDPRNAGSIRVLEKLGFRETHRAARTYHIAGEWSDSVYLRIDRPDG